MSATSPAVRPRVVAAVPTPFDDREEVDFEAAAVQAAHLVSAGCDGIFVGGTTGEYPALTVGEREQLFEVTADGVGPDRIIAHVGAACARDAERLAARAEAIGVSDIAAASPYFTPIDADSHFEYFSRIAHAGGASRLWLYLFPERTGNRVDDRLLDRLLKLPTLHGAKVSSPGAEVVGWLCARSEGRLQVSSGSDPDLLEAFMAGASGIVSGLSCVAPSVYLALADAWAAGDELGATAAQVRIRLLRRLVGRSTEGIKAVLRAQGIPAGRCRMSGPEPTRVDRRVLALANEGRSDWLQTSRPNSSPL